MRGRALPASFSNSFAPPAIPSDIERTVHAGVDALDGGCSSEWPRIPLDPRPISKRSDGTGRPRIRRRIGDWPFTCQDQRQGLHYVRRSLSQAAFSM